MLAVVGVLVHLALWTVALGYSGADASDFNAYRDASLRLLDGFSPYLPAHLNGPIEIGTWGYLYPPPLAQTLAPVARLPESLTSGLWYVLQFVSVYAATWLGAGLGGSSRSLERGLWCLVATLLFLPAWLALWFANVSGFVALGSTLVAFGGTAAGVSAAAMALLKVSPVAFVPAVVAMSHRARAALAISLLAIVGVSFVLAPAAWFEFPTVLMNLLGGSGNHPSSLAPASVAAQLGLPGFVVTAVRVAALLAGGLAVLASIWLARRRAGYPAAALMGTVAMLLVPGQFWYHYLVVLLPFAAMAWPRAGTTARVGLVASAGLVSISMTMEPLALAGATVLVVVAAHSLWPRDRGAPEPVTSHA